ncbi:MAG: hypothetical protein ABJM06_14385 [Gilvibacter sp.]
MTLEIIVFAAAILLGIVLYWRESKNNKLYRFFNRLTHTKELQLPKDNPKGFLYEQAFLMRLVWIATMFLIAAVVVFLVTPFNAFALQYFVSAIVGALAGTYIASAFFVTKEGLTKENLIETIQKGKDFIEDIAEPKEKAEPVLKDEVQEEIEQEAPKAKEMPEPKSARDRLKDKGMIK